MSLEATDDSIAVIYAHAGDSIRSGLTTSISMMKIDVEGFNCLCSRAAEILSNSRPVLYVENDRVEKSAALIEWLQSQNYRLWWHIPLLFNPNNFFQNEVDHYPAVGSFNMLGLPRELNMEMEGSWRYATRYPSSAPPIVLEEWKGNTVMFRLARRPRSEEVRRIACGAVDENARRGEHGRKTTAHQKHQAMLYQLEQRVDKFRADHKLNFYEGATRQSLQVDSEGQGIRRRIHRSADQLADDQLQGKPVS